MGATQRVTLETLLECLVPARPRRSAPGATPRFATGAASGIGVFLAKICPDDQFGDSRRVRSEQFGYIGGAMPGTNFGSDPSGGFNGPSKAYKAKPTLEHYVQLRRSDPEAEIEVSVIGGFESMFYMRDEFSRHGLDPNLLGGLLDLDPNAISETCLQLMESIIASRKRAAEGQTHLASRGEIVPDKLIDWIVCCMLDAMSWADDQSLSRDLIVLIRERLGGSTPHYEQVGRVREAKSNAAMVAGQLKAQGINPTLRVLGEAFRVAPSTVKRWFEPGELERETEVWARLFDEKGQLRPLPPATKSDVAHES